MSRRRGKRRSGASDTPDTPSGRSGAPRYMLDANAFDHLLDRDVDPRAVRELGEIWITDVQHRELLEVPDRRRRRRLLGVLSAIDPIVRPAARGAGADDPPWDERAAGGTALPGAARTPPGAVHPPARSKDAAIGEVARREGCTLVTDDRAFGRLAVARGVTVLSCAEAFAGLDRPTSTPGA